MNKDLIPKLINVNCKIGKIFLNLTIRRISKIHKLCSAIKKKFLLLVLFKCSNTIFSPFLFIVFCGSCVWVLGFSRVVKLPTVLDKKPPGPISSLLSQHALHISFLPHSDFMILRFSVGTQDNWGTRTQQLQKAASSHWFSRRRHMIPRTGHM